MVLLLENYLEDAMTAIDVAILGAGTAGLSAGSVTASKGKSTLIIGSHTTSNLYPKKKVKNYPGVSPDTSGPKILEQAKELAQKAGAQFLETSIKTIAKDDQAAGYTLTAEDGQIYVAKAVVIATGDKPKRLDAPELPGIIQQKPSKNDERLQDARVAVIGSGPDAVKKASIALKQAKVVHIVIRGKELKTTSEKLKKLESNKNVTLIYEKTIKQVLHESGKVTGLLFEDGSQLACDAVISAIGRCANIPEIMFKIDQTEGDYIVTAGKTFATSAPGIFAAGACIDKAFGYKQAIIASGEGMLAGYEVVGYLNNTLG